MAMDQLSTTLPHIRAGTLVPIAVSGSARLSFLPDVPTVSEKLLPKYRNDSYQGVFAPAQVPPQIVAALGAAIQRAISGDEKIRSHLTDLGGIPVGNSPAEFKVIVDDSGALLRDLVESAGIVAR